MGYPMHYKDIGSLLLRAAHHNLSTNTSFIPRLREESSVFVFGEGLCTYSASCYPEICNPTDLVTDQEISRRNDGNAVVACDRVLLEGCRERDIGVVSPRDGQSPLEVSRPEVIIGGHLPSAGNPLLTAVNLTAKNSSNSRTSH